jgi:aspartyl-tRNA(Asn)/glutamyl-tRNA(Gln) amidotransferase subunit B
MSTSVYDKYEAVIGLEVHAQLLTKSKAFSSDPNEYGTHPNTNVSPISLGHPGTLPVHNKEAVKFAVKLGIACNSNIREYNEYARKNYFYADLPKGYQITQDKTPICTGGFINIKLAGGERKKVGITRIHMEEDAGKSMHDQDVYNTLIDLNRAGVPLLEIVSEPDMRSGEEAYQYVTEVRKLVRYLDICDGNMEEGSLRCDANISVRLRDAPVFGTKVEVKNMNSMRNVQRAIEHEIKRQIDELEAGRTFDSETRSFDALKGTTFSMRSKEAANDYRYFPEPDLPPVIVAQDFISEVKAGMPALPEELVEKYTVKLGLSAYDAHVLTENKETAAYFEEVTAHTSNVKSAANWVMGAVRSHLNEQAMDLKDFTLSPKTIADLILLIDEGKISNSAASQKIFPELVKNPSLQPLSVAESLNLLQESNADALKSIIDEVIGRFPEKVTEYKSGKTSLVGMFMGEVMKLSKGKADPKVASQLVKETLDNL